MNLVFGPDDEEAFEVARDRIVAAITDVDGSVLGNIAGQVLDLKWSYLGGDLDHWSPEDVVKILLNLYPAKVMLDEADMADVPTGFAVLLRFLGSDRPRHEPSLEVLAEFVGRLTSRFLAAMNDEDNWSFGKRIWSTATAEGVDLADQSAMEGWLKQFNERPVAERDQIFGPMSSPAPGGALIGPLPPVVLPTDDELRMMAHDATVMKRLIRLVEYVGSGRAVTDRGNLKLADGKELVTLLETDDRFDKQIHDKVFKTVSSEELDDVDFIYRLALAADMLIIKGHRLLPGPSARSLPDDSINIYYTMFLVLLQQVGPTQHHYRKHRYGFDWFAEELDGQLPSIMIELYRDRKPYEIDDLAVQAWAYLNDVFDIPDVAVEKLDYRRSSVEFMLRNAFDRLAEMGIITIADEVHTPTHYGMIDRSAGTVRLTPLGLWALQRFASKITNAPVVGALRSSSAAVMLRAAADLSHDLARAEVDAWVDHHGDGSASELCVAIREADETGRGLAFQALLRIGANAADAIAGLADDVELAAFVTVWRVDVLAASAQEMDRSGDPEGWVRLLHAVVELWGPQAAAAVWAIPAAGAPGLQAMLDTAWRVKGERTDEVLAAIGGHHPDKLVAKAARKVLLKHRNVR